MLDSDLKDEARRICQDLVNLGYWPATGNNKYNYPAYQMWENYGVDWHQFREPWYCPECKSDLRNHEAGAPFKREVGIIVNDMVHHWRCPDCGATWPRGSNPNPV